MTDIDPQDYSDYHSPEAAQPPSADTLLVLPHSVEAEQSVVGGLMQDVGHFDAVAEILADNP